MSDYARNEEGFARAFEDAKWMARHHPQIEYALYVDRLRNERYTVCMATFVRQDMVEEGTQANKVLADGTMFALFD